MRSILMKKLRQVTRLLFAITMTGALTFLLFWGINDVTGVFTYMHLERELQIIEHSKDLTLTQKMIEELTEDSKSVFMWKRKIAAIEFGKLGNKAESAIPELKRLTNDKDYEVREAAKQALEKIRSEHKAK